MPINNKLPDLNLPVALKTGEKPQTVYEDQVHALGVTLMYAPSYNDLLSFIPEFGTATWRDTPHEEITDEERRAVILDLFDGKILPTAYECINLVFRFEGMDIIDTTHLLRHRMFSFSAQCTADRDLRHDNAVVKSSIMANADFYERYRQITEASKQLYADMIDSNEVSILDARTILTRNLNTFYYVRGNLKDCMAYIQQRLDEQIQPTSDNILATLMWIRICEKYPMLVDRIKIGGIDNWYVKTAPTGRSSNIYMPKKENDVFEYKKQWFLYDKRREDFPGYETYQAGKDAAIEHLAKIKQRGFTI